MEAKMNDAEILNPKSLVPNCAELLLKYKSSLDLLNESLYCYTLAEVDYCEVDKVKVIESAQGFNSIVDEIEYLTRM
jgi:hypothetical protein